jgi:heptaprenyl diphosphate synthase
MINDAILGEYGSFSDFDSAFNMVKEEVERTLSSAPLIIRKYTKHLAKAQGKFIRAVSLLTCAQKKDGTINQSAGRIAAAIEILHLATLVHDDVIDDAGIRRGIPTLQKKYGKRTAVICGDYLLSVALKMTASVYRDYPGLNLENMDAAEYNKEFRRLNLPDYISRVCLGELNQHINNGNLDLSVYQYLKIISGKTAALFEASFCAGAILSGCEEEEIRKYRRLGRQIGMIFQLMDDCMDFEATENTAKKPVQSDFEQNVITLPLIRALHTQQDFKKRIREAGATREEINRAVEKSGGIVFSRMVAARYHDKALKIIRELIISPEKEAALLAILKIVYRES